MSHRVSRLVAVAILASGCRAASDRPSGDTAATDTAAIEARGDTLLSAVNDTLANIVWPQLNNVQMASVVNAASDPGEVVARFFAALPLDTTPVGPGIAEDSVFRAIGKAPKSVQRAAESFAWGTTMDYIQEFKNEKAKPQLPAVWKRLTCPVTGCLATGREMAVDKRRAEPMIVAIERPDVEQFLNAPLTSPATTAAIVESRHEDARTSIGKAYCKGGVPAIHYAPNVDTVFSPISFAFIRAHELAHINLRHIRCDGDRPGEPGLPTPRDRELAAEFLHARLERNRLSCDEDASRQALVKELLNSIMCHRLTPRSDGHRLRSQQPRSAVFVNDARSPRSRVAAHR
jgi:hypothetical protein